MNDGLASPRSVNIDHHTTGDHLLFLDADDEVVPDELDILRKRISQQPSHSTIPIGSHYAQKKAVKDTLHNSGDLAETMEEKLQAYDKISRMTSGAPPIHRFFFAGIRYPKQSHDSKSIAIFAYILAGLIYRVIDSPIAYISKKHTDSLRHNTHHRSILGFLLTGEVLYENRISAYPQNMKKPFWGQRDPSLVRTYFFAEHHVKTHFCYYTAWQHGNKLLHNWHYMKKAVEGFIFQLIYRIGQPA